MQSIPCVATSRIRVAVGADRHPDYGPARFSHQFVESASPPGYHPPQLPEPAMTLMTRLLAVLAVLAAVGPASRSEPAKDKDARTWTDTFAVESGELGPTGRNPFFILEPGYVLVLRKGNEEV